MTITVKEIMGTAEGAAAITLLIQSGKEEQTIGGVISPSALLELGLASEIGKCFEIDRMTADAILREMKKYAAIQKGIALLGFSQKTRKVLAQKLRQKGYPADIAEEAVDYLASHGYIREIENAALFAETLAVRRQYGKKRISRELFAKGFPSEIISEVLDGLEADFAEICACRMRKMGGFAVLKTPESRQKAIATLMRYGFSYEEIKEAAELLQNDF